MIRLKTFFIILVFVIASPGKTIWAQQAGQVSATGEIFAEVISVFSAGQKTQLNFGRFSPGHEGGEIILSPESSISLLGSIYKGPGSHNAASFYVSGDSDTSYSISLPDQPVIIKSVSGERSMIVDNWKSIPEEGTGTGLLQGGYQLVYIGATLKVGSVEDNPAGIYSGSYSVTFDFN